MEASLVVDLTRAWGAALVVFVSPDSLISSQGWAETRATCVPATGDGYSEVCHVLTEQGDHEEASIVA
eukprot:8468870-Lingulodinium_polyedra.AAC.1